ncbi:MAG: RNA polymerase sigma factor RpoE [uncultured Frankineae bacterium]|uniref:RNA polymerase sigma factor RpoE n=1 Tax=uncultured Frankineae bacterium TaxID=437475 RepID=A0A6J4KQJ9_9ACTN|nr:MAG: RNA polymerase sigma factor RpoE [uncultured Frankineae bacterium]
MGDDSRPAPTVDEERAAVDTAPTDAADADPDARLLVRLRAGDEAAFSELVDRWSAPMLRVALIHTGTRAVAEEAVQDTWLAVLQGLDRFEGRSTLRTWVFRILLYTCRGKAERERRVPPISDVQRSAGEMTGRRAFAEDRFLPSDHPHWPGHWSQPPRSWMRTPDDALLGSELRQHLSQAVAALPERQRQVLVLRDVEGWTSEEVCRLLGVLPGNQRVLLHRARSTVRAALEPYLTVERP